MSDHSPQVIDFFNKPDRYLSKNSGLNIRGQIVRKLLKEIPHNTILDIGCGDGSLSMQFITEVEHLILIDFSSNMLDLCRRRVPPDLVDRVTFVESNFETFSPKQDFDIVLCIGVLAHVNSLDLAFEKMASFVRNGGYCIIQFSDQEKLVTSMQFRYFQLRRKMNDSYKYKINPIWNKKLMLLAKQNNLILEKQESYWSMSPGTGLLPSSLILTLLECVNKKKLLADFGGEKIWLLRKA